MQANCYRRRSTMEEPNSMWEVMDRHPGNSSFGFQLWRGSESIFFSDDLTDAGDALTNLTIQKETP
jgi:hypothetical protein